jgi:hypothetical protein
MQWILIGGILLMNSFPQLLLIELCFFAATTIFSLSLCQLNMTLVSGVSFREQKMLTQQNMMMS